MVIPQSPLKAPTVPTSVCTTHLPLDVLMVKAIKPVCAECSNTELHAQPKSNFTLKMCYLPCVHILCFLINVTLALKS